MKNQEIRGFEHFFSPVPDRFGRLSSRFRGLLGGVQKASDRFFDIFSGSGRKIVHKNVKISNFQKFALLGASLKESLREAPKSGIFAKLAYFGTTFRLEPGKISKNPSEAF